MRLNPAPAAAVLIHLALWLPATAEEARTRVELSLEEAVRQALVNNLDLEIERVKPRIAGERITEARAEFHPYLDYSLSYSRQNRFLNSTLERQAADGIVRETRILPEAAVEGKLSSGAGYKLSATASTVETDNPLRLFDLSYQPQIALSFQQPLLKGFGRSYNLVRLRQAEHLERQAALEVKAAMLEVIRDVETRYWLLAYAQQHLEISQGSLETAENLVERLTRMRQAGMATDLDVSQARLAGEERRAGLARAEADLKIARLRLRVVVDPDLPPETEVVALETPLDEGPPDGLQEKIDRALGARPEIEYQESVIESMSLEEMQARSNARWKLDGYGSASYSSLGGKNLNPSLTDPLGGIIQPSPLPPQPLPSHLEEIAERDSLGSSFQGGNKSWTLGFNLQIPLGSRSSLAQLAPKRLRRTQEEIKLERVRQQIRTELETAFHNMTAEWSRLNSAREAVRLAQLQVNAEERNLEVGINTVWDVIQAQDRLAKALDSEGRALALYAGARSRMQAAQALSFQIYRLVVRQ